MQDVLVLGDWFVDDYWLTRHGSGETSGLEGTEYLIAHGVPGNTKVLALCGAGRVARMLYWLGRFGQDGQRLPRGNEALRVFGLGLWAQVDTCRVFKLFHPTYGKRMNPYTLVGGVEPEDRRRLDELDDLYLQSLWAAAETRSPAEFTPRVFRIYKSDARRPLKLDRRIDFEPRILADSDDPYDTPALSKLLSKISRAKSHKDHFRGDIQHLRMALQKHFEYVEILEGREALRQAPTPPGMKTPADDVSAGPIDEKREPFRHVVVADHGRGAISRSLIEKLADTRLVSKSTRWYILTKSPRPRWFSELKEQSGVGSVALLYYHPAATDHLPLKPAVADESDSIESWLISCGERPGQPRDRARLTQDALLALENDGGLRWTDDALLVATPKGLQVAGLARNKKEWKWEIGSADRDAEPSDEPQVGRSSAFFARLAAWAILCEGRYDPWEAIQDARKEARSYVQNMVAHFHDRLEDRERGSEDALPIGVDTEPPKARSGRGELTCLADSAATWELLKIPPTLAVDRLELWRAMQDVPDYVAIDPKKRGNIRRLQRGLREFAERSERTRQTYAAMITAPPASGKTTLVKKLAEMNHLVLQECNLTQILDRPQLLLFLDRLAHVQSGTDHPLLVFVDEINTPVAGHPAYDVFLSVLSGGTFGTAGDVRRLRPAAWLFVGTSPLKAASNEHGTMSPEFLATKEPDFRTRMNAPDISIAAEGEALRTEMFFVWMVKLYDRGVRRVTRGLLQHVWDQMKDRTSLRDIEKLIDQLRNLPADRPLRVRDIDPLEASSEDLTSIRLEREPEIRVMSTTISR